MTDPERSVFPDGWTVRPAAEADTAQLTALEIEARAALIDVRGGAALLAEQPTVDDWSSVLTDGHHRVWVAVIDDVVVGYLQLRHASGEPTGVVVQVYVSPDAREVGFGDVLLAEAIDAIRTSGGVCVESFALPGDRDTKNLYERAGVTARKIIVSKRFDR
jgi:ribosomal protein S18 acetylase RimI-like enzyme